MLFASDSKPHSSAFADRYTILPSPIASAPRRASPRQEWFDRYSKLARANWRSDPQKPLLAALAATCGRWPQPGRAATSAIWPRTLQSDIAKSAFACAAAT